MDGAIRMCKYGLEMVLETEPYKTVRLSVTECDTKAEAERELKEWLEEKPELVEQAANKRVIAIWLHGSVDKK